MSLPKLVTLAVFILSASPALAAEAYVQSPVGVWQPPAADQRYTDRTALIFSDAGRFAALVSQGPELLDAASGSWMLAEDGGEVVLTFDKPSAKEAPGTTRYLKMLLLGDELRAYPGMEGRSPLGGPTWRRVDDAFVSGLRDRASR